MAGLELQRIDCSYSIMLLLLLVRGSETLSYVLHLDPAVEYRCPLLFILLSYTYNTSPSYWSPRIATYLVIASSVRSVATRRFVRPSVRMIRDVHTAGVPKFQNVKNCAHLAPFLSTRTYVLLFRRTIIIMPLLLLLAGCTVVLVLFRVLPLPLTAAVPLLLHHY